MTCEVVDITLLSRETRFCYCVVDINEIRAMFFQKVFEGILESKELMRCVIQGTSCLIIELFFKDIPKDCGISY